MADAHARLAERLSRDRLAAATALVGAAFEAAAGAVVGGGGCVGQVAATGGAPPPICRGVDGGKVTREDFRRRCWPFVAHPKTLRGKFEKIYEVMGRKSARRGVDEMLANGERVDARRKTIKQTKR